MNYQRLCFAILLIALCSGAALAQAQSHTAARVWEAPLALPTYELGPPDLNPPLFDRTRTRGRPSYPYPLLDSLTNRRVDKTYNAVFLENEYLRVTVLPELGGKLYAIYDKTAGRDALYTNHVVKYAMVGIRGAWTSGGIEWNFPDGHTLTTVSPVDYVTRMEEDGSAAVVVGDTERVQRMQWAVAIRLRPGRKVVETEVTLNNRRETPGRYWFWATAAAPATDDMRFIYPMREAYPHAFWPVFSFPKEKGVDLSAYREVTNYLSLFARDSRRDFFGVYYEKSDWGIAHVADRHELPGKKTWTWGTDEAGKIWIDKLTDNDGQYVEFQAGRFETQMEHEFIAPHRVERFTEYWFPLDKLGGLFNKVTKDVALRVEVIGDQARITANASAKFDDAELFIAASGKQIHSSRINLSPATPFAATVKLPAPMVIVVRIRTKDGRELVHYYTDSPPDGNSDFKPATRPLTDQTAPNSAEQAYVAGLAADKKSNEQAARAAYEEALKRDSGFAPAHIALGLSFYRAGEYDRAAEHLETALRRNRDAGDAHYYLALVRRAQNRVGEAIEQLMWCVRAGHRESVARYALGEIYLAADSIDGALEHLSQAAQLDPRDLKARTALAVAERRAGKLDIAQARINEIVREAPIDYFALHERYSILKERKQDAQAERAWTELWRLLAREPDALLELVFDYAALGRAEALTVAEKGFYETTYRQKKPPHPMLLYLLNSSSNQMAAAAKVDPAYVFPHRVEEIAVLQATLKANPTDGRAAYYLGNALASKLRFKEALEAWRIAVRFDANNAVAHRNYARALALVEDKKEEAATALERAIALAPDDHHLYLELDQLLAGMKQTERRIKLLEGASEKARTRTALLQSLTAAYVDAGRFAEAVGLLERHAFTSGEGEGAALGLYRRAHLALAKQHQQAGRHAEAAAAFIKATEYPPNFGVGRPALQSQAREYVAAAREFEAAGKRDEAERWLRRAAEDALNSPTQPEEPWSEHYYYKAVALDHLGRRDEARALYERLARLNDEQQMLSAEPAPPRGALRFLLAGWGLKALGRNEEARAAFQRALQLDPANDRAQAELGVAAQRSVSMREVNEVAKPAANQTIAIVGATLIDGRGGSPVNDAVVIVRGEKIVAVGARAAVPIPKAAALIEANGLTLLPGLIDAHFHLDGDEGLPSLFLSHGITSVRDPGAWMEAYDSARQSGQPLPRLFLAGPHLDDAPPAYPHDAFIVRDAEETRLAVNRFVEQGASVIKVYFRLPLGLIRVAVETAHARDVPVTAHLEIVDAADAIRAGVDGIEHITSFGAALPPPREAEKYRQAMLADNNARREGRYKVWSELDLNTSRARSLLALIAQRGTFVSPTLAVFEKQAGDKGATEMHARAFSQMLKFVGMVKRAGGRVVAGSHSSVPRAERGWAYQRELELLVASGLSPMEALVAGTMENARFFRIADRLGSIEAGKLADLILIDGDPLKDLAALRRIRRVMLNGKWVEPGSEKK